MRKRVRRRSLSRAAGMRGRWGRRHRGREVVGSPGTTVGTGCGASDGFDVGSCVGITLGRADGSGVGLRDGASVGAGAGALEGRDVGSAVSHSDTFAASHSHPSGQPFAVGRHCARGEVGRGRRASAPVNSQPGARAPRLARTPARKRSHSPDVRAALPVARGPVAQHVWPTCCDQCRPALAPARDAHRVVRARVQGETLDAGVVQRVEPRVRQRGRRLFRRRRAQAPPPLSRSRRSAQPAFSSFAVLVGTRVRPPAGADACDTSGCSSSIFVMSARRDVLRESSGTSFVGARSTTIFVLFRHCCRHRAAVVSRQ